MENKIYDDSFFTNRKGMKQEGFDKISDWIINNINPKSVVDVGCGLGDFSKSLYNKGLEVQAIDGSWVDLDQLVIPKDLFKAIDLNQSFTLEKSFDLAISLEVAEHLKPENSEQFVKSLISLAPIVLFSAAIPFQDGVGHINCNYQSFWAVLFNKYGFKSIDAFRPSFWNDQSVRYWYRQNAILYVHESKFNFWKEKFNSNHTNSFIDFVHPDHFELKAKELQELKNAIPKKLRSLFIRLNRIGK